MSKNVVHCSFIERHGKATEARDRHAPLLADLEADGATTGAHNRAFRAPSVINNALQTSIVSPVDLSALAPLLPPGLQPAVAQPFPLVVGAVGSDIPIGGMSQDELTEESLTAYEVSYAGVLPRGTTLGGSFYVNRRDDSINFVSLPRSLDPYTAANPPHPAGGSRRSCWPSWRSAGSFCRAPHSPT